ncbi:hypothetical protein GGE07_003318 [Sinorhizobium terangae]|nr:hypothetical protein [Sinorhizobium terangae]
MALRKRTGAAFGNPVTFYGETLYRGGKDIIVAPHKKHGSLPAIADTKTNNRKLASDWERRCR